MSTRDAAPTALLGSLFRAVGERARADGDAARVATTSARALEEERPSSSPEPARLPTCAHLEAYDPPDVLHAMRSGPDPLLAVRCLWNGNGGESAP